MTANDSTANGTTDTVLATTTNDGPGRGLNITLWILQGLSGPSSSSLPARSSSAKPPRSKDSSASARRLVPELAGLVELAGGVGLVIPRLSGLAAIGLGLTMVGAAYTNTILADGMWPVSTPLLLLVLFVFVAWGRWYQTGASSSTVSNAFAEPSETKGRWHRHRPFTRMRPNETGVSCKSLKAPANICLQVLEARMDEGTPAGDELVALLAALRQPAPDARRGRPRGRTQLREPTGARPQHQPRAAPGPPQETRSGRARHLDTRSVRRRQGHELLRGRPVRGATSPPKPSSAPRRRSHF